ncbi:uncharacterized protein LOC141684889 [Apium graveolens]|uniref:uncharacterized protein LOC141684889 n=1 Tax=Apium graveolens TaxID=4045 RepID=UPI003D7AF458
MNAIAWNCRGVGSPRTVRLLKEMIKSRKPDVLFLSETLADNNKIDCLAAKIGFVNFFSVEKHGRGEGLVVFWSNKINVSIFGSSDNHIDIIIQENSGYKWRLTCFYGFPGRERRQESCNFLRHLSSVSHLAWCVFGDFNDLLYSSDKRGKNEHPYSLMEGFRKAIDDASLIELELKDGEFTWEKSKGTTSWVQEKLDRCFATEAWWSKFPLCMLSVFHVTASDHDPIKLELMCTSISKKQFRFRFENTWLKEPNFHAEVSSFWQQLPAIHLLPKLVELSRYMSHWGREFFNKFREKVIRQKKVIDELKVREDDDGLQLYFEEKERLNEILIHEEVY